jgi:hypothetical protein
LKAHDQPTPGLAPETGERRIRPRFKLEVEIKVDSRTCGLLKGQTLDISESGISALLTIEVPLHELVELEFTLPYGPVNIYAMVRQRSAFRYGFQFVQSEAVAKLIRPTCRQLAMEQSLRGGH